ncbi:MAG: response regulator [Thermodesulfovibrionales bacterium]
MYRVLIADDDYEDRELLKMEIQEALRGEEEGINFYEASSVKQAMEMLGTRIFDLLTLDIEFDRMDEGLRALPDIFEAFPTLNIIVISGKISKQEVAEQLFRFTKENVFKSKRWARHFDVLDKKDDKKDAIRRAFSFAFKQKEVADSVRDLLLLAESHLEKEEVDKCLNVYEKIQQIAPGEFESHENIQLFRDGVSAEQALDYFRRGEKIVASLILGHFLERRLKRFTQRVTGQSPAGLYDCLKALERSGSIGSFKKKLFRQILRLRNKAIHHPTTITEKDFDASAEDLRILEARF